jgi:phospholipase C
VSRAVTTGPDWGSTLMIWLYDEHGGFYDHVPSPRATKPDAIAPKTAKGDYPGGYDQLGVRVPAVVISPWARPHAVTNVVHDHTSVLAEIERTWNLPALTYRDANAADLRDFLDLKHAALQRPPALAAPGAIDLRSCSADH